jgi:hypothetical protein
MARRALRVAEESSEQIDLSRRGAMPRPSFQQRGRILYLKQVRVEDVAHLFDDLEDVKPNGGGSEWITIEPFPTPVGLTK